MTDLYIRPDVRGYSAASFNKEAIDTLLVRGGKAALLKWDELMELKRELGLDSLQGERSPEGGVVQDTFWIRDIYLKGFGERSGLDKENYSPER